MQKINFLPRAEVRSRFGGISDSTIGNRVRARLLTHGIPLCGSNNDRAPGAKVFWPEHEINEISAAILAGKSDSQLREIVERLETQRVQPERVAA